MLTHPEAKTDEIYLGNTTKPLAEHPGFGKLQTLRTGNQAYDLDGKKIGPWCRPLLLHKSEADAYNDVMMTRTFGPHWRQRVSH